MKKSTTILHTEPDLAAAAVERLRSDPDLTWRLSIPKGGNSRSDTLVHLVIGDQDLTFLPDFKIQPTSALIEALAQRSASAKYPPLLIVPRLSERFVELCRKAKVACLDLNGRVWIHRGNVLVDRAPPANHQPIVATPPEPDLFSGKSSRVPRALLSTSQPWTQAELATATGVSRPQLSRLLELLAREGFVRRAGSSRGGTWTIAQPEALLAAWARRDLWSRRVSVHQYSILVPTLESAARQLQGALGKDNVAFTQWFAAERRHPYMEAPVLSVYVHSLPSAEILKSLSARSVPTGGRLWLLRPQDDGVFQFTQQADGFTLAADIQIYLDLLQVGQRGPDAAEALRQWEGFAR